MNEILQFALIFFACFFFILYKMPRRTFLNFFEAFLHYLFCALIGVSCSVGVLKVIELIGGGAAPQ